MPIYQYETLVELPDDEAARVVIQNIHLAVCGGDTHVGEGGEIVHECQRWWRAQVHGFVPVPSEEPLEGAVDFVEEPDDDTRYSINDDGPFKDAPANADEIREG